MNKQERESLTVCQRLTYAPTDPESDLSLLHITPSYPPQSERGEEVATSEETETQEKDGVEHLLSLLSSLHYLKSHYTCVKKMCARETAITPCEVWPPTNIKYVFWEKSADGLCV